MNPNELRIGNWIADRGSKQWQIDHWETKDKISAKSPLVKFGELEIEGHPLTEEVLFLKPIQITEEWLVRFGFEKTDDYGDIIYYAPKNYVNRHYYVCFDHDNISFGLSVFNNCTSLIYDEECLQYVHQLQNLYFALTGEELELIN